MPGKLLDATVNVIVAYLQADQHVNDIVKATKASKSTIYTIRLNLDVFGTPYKPNTVKQGRLCTILRVYKLVCNILSYKVKANLL
jgi:hypothetical protein